MDATGGKFIKFDNAETANLNECFYEYKTRKYRSSYFILRKVQVAIRLKELEVLIV